MKSQDWLKEYKRLDNRMWATVTARDLHVEQLQDVRPDVDVQLRKATAEDILPGALIYYCDEDGIEFVAVVEQVYSPGDYVGIDGCMYGLHNAYVEKKQI